MNAAPAPVRAFVGQNRFLLVFAALSSLVSAPNVRAASPAAAGGTGTYEDVRVTSEKRPSANASRQVVTANA